VAKVDIRKFFPSTKLNHIKSGFRATFQCSPDVAYLVALLCTFEGHLPTGSPLSCLVAYYAHKRLFDAVSRMAENRDLTLTCYVDDITISGPGLTRQHIAMAKKLIKAAGLTSHDRKGRFYKASAVKIVTGVVVDEEGAKLPNRRQRAIYDGLSQLGLESDPAERSRMAARLTGRVVEAAQVDSLFRARQPWFEQRIRLLTSEAPILAIR
jgi:hypothetical protein